MSAALLAGGCGGSDVARPVGAATPSSRTWSDAAARVSATIPAGWHVTGRPATGVAAPLQRLTITSFAVHQRRPDRSCGPTTARRQMPADGAMLFLFEYRGPSAAMLRAAEPRPARFGLDRAALNPYECMGRSYLLMFREHGRLLQAHAYLGRRASQATRERLIGVLDSLRFGTPDPRAAAVWVAPYRLLRSPPRLGVACPMPNRFGCDRVGLAVALRHPAVSVTASLGRRPFPLDGAPLRGGAHAGPGRAFAGFLRPAGLRHGPLAITPDTADGRWLGRHPVSAGIELLIERRPRRFVRTSLVVPLAPGWG
ncbi:MAG TPA: hypothetical protein VFT50_01310 [Baekduia sp.]|nr:hypothetical protein [Baekduia sp.]